MGRGQALGLDVASRARPADAARAPPRGPTSTLAPVSTNEIYQSTLTVLVRRLVAVLGIAALVGGVVLAVVQPAAYGGWVLIAFGVAMGLLVWRQKQLTDDGLVLRRTALRAKD
jgi:Flp pilus assembly protein TadB